MYFKEIRDAALLAHFNGDIGDEELAIIHDFYRSQPTVLPTSTSIWTDIPTKLVYYSSDFTKGIYLISRTSWGFLTISTPTMASIFTKSRHFA